MTAGPRLELAIGEAVADALAATLPEMVDRLAELGGPRAYSVAEVAKRLDLSETTVRALIHDGYLPTVPHLPRIRVSAAALADFLACHRRQETS